MKVIYLETSLCPISDDAVTTFVKASLFLHVQYMCSSMCSYVNMVVLLVYTHYAISHECNHWFAYSCSYGNNYDLGHVYGGELVASSVVCFSWEVVIVILCWGRNI